MTVEDDKQFVRIYLFGIVKSDKVSREGKGRISPIVQMDPF